MIKVLLAEDQTIVRRGIVALLALTQDIRVTAEASDGAEALTAAMTGDFDVALLDIRMPHLSGTQVIKEWAGTSSILSKLGARDRTRAVLRGIERGLL